MDKLEALLASIANATVPLKPITLSLPLAPVSPIQTLLAHLTTAKVHETYFPFLRFGAIHAARASSVWVTMTRGRKARVSVLQDLFGYLTLAWGGGTAAALLLAEPPAWLVSPTPWLIYPAVYILLVPTGLAAYVVDTAPALPLNLAMSYVDGMTRGVTIAALPKAIAASGVSANWWTQILLSGVAVNGGGWLIQTFGLHRDSWTPGRPAILDGGLLGTLDMWSGMLVGLIYAALTRAHSELDPISNILANVIPEELREPTGSTAIVSTDMARAIVVLILGCLFAARAVTLQAVAWRTEAKRLALVKKDVEIVVKENISAQTKSIVVKSPASKGPTQVRERKSTPRKSPRLK